MPININHIAVYLPAEIVTNEMLAERFPELNPDDIFKRTGVKERRKTSDDFIMSDMAYEAAEKLFESDGSLREKIDAIILIGHGYDYKAPITAAILQDKLKLSKNILSIDLPHGCTGYINGLAVSKGLIEGGMATNILLLTGDTPSYVIDKNNSELLSIFSDSATASHITEGNEKPNEKFVFGTDGSGAKNLIVNSSSSRVPASSEYLISGGRPNGTMTMDGVEIFKFAIRIVPQLISETLEKNKLTIDKIDFIIFHQANSFMLEILRKKLKIEKEKYYNDISLTGNTVASTIPIALKNAHDKKLIKRGDTVLLAGFGLGYTWGATIIKF